MILRVVLESHKYSGETHKGLNIDLEPLMFLCRYERIDRPSPYTLATSSRENYPMLTASVEQVRKQDEARYKIAQEAGAQVAEFILDQLRLRDTVDGYKQ